MRELFRSLEAKHVFFAATILAILNNLVWYDKYITVANYVEVLGRVCGVSQ